MKTFVPIVILVAIAIVGCTQSSTLSDIRDMELKKSILNRYDQNKDFVLSKEESNDVVAIQIPSKTTSLNGLDMFCCLNSIKACRGSLRVADVSECKSLKMLTITDMPNLKKVELPPNLTSLVLINLPITELDLEEVKNLQALTITETKIENLDVSMLMLLRKLSCNYIGLKTLTLSKQQKIIDLDISATTTIIYVD